MITPQLLLSLYFFFFIIFYHRAYFWVVEIVFIGVTYNTFNRSSDTQHIYGHLRAKLFSIYFLFYVSGLFKNPRVCTKRRVKRTIVVLKSPFHYKSPKHHIQYSYYSVYASVRVPYKGYKRVAEILSSYFIQNRAHRVLVRAPQTLSLRDAL